VILFYVTTGFIMTTYTSTVNKIAAIIGENEFSQETIEVLACIVDEHEHSIDEDSKDELIEALEAIDGETDCNVEFDGNEYRIISDSEIESVYRDEIKALIDDCYPEVTKAMEHSWIAIEIDWDQTIKNAMQDGYGHTFSWYDGSEYNTKNHWVFRTN
jgi:hypothetical protein